MIRHRTLKRLASFLMLLMALWTSGCSWQTTGASKGDLQISSRTNPESIKIGGFDHAIYASHGKSILTAVLTDGPIDHPKRALIVRMFWRPKAAATPLDETATNATVQYIVFDRVNNTVGIYSGGGFLFPETDLTQSTLHANLWQATLNLSEKSEGFEDTYGPSLMTGRFTASRNDEYLPEAVRQVNIAVSEVLGVPRFVHAD
ncbi:MAG: hypothetical protein D6698_13565 [Gammaproteobacteria bacterium]|nr:MAG: hypothetical protein D6698_13565 [Gammaproteobacteria bacterium]